MTLPSSFANDSNMIAWDGWADMVDQGWLVVQRFLLTRKSRDAPITLFLYRSYSYEKKGQRIN